MDDATLTAYDHAAKTFADEWAAQPPPTDLQSSPGLDGGSKLPFTHGDGRSALREMEFRFGYFSVLCGSPTGIAHDASDAAPLTPK
jgi:hypothetical protein